MSTTQLPAHFLTAPWWHTPTEHRPGSPPRHPAHPAAGTVLAVPGRGDGPGSLSGLADRLALDGYRVHVLDGGEPQETAARLGAAARHRAADRSDAPARPAGRGWPHEPHETPVLLLGVDTGALAVLLATRQGTPSTGLVLAGMPGDSRHVATSGPEELRVRLRDPVQRDRLAANQDLRLGELLADPLPVGELDALFDDEIGVPTLVLHGDSDPLCPFPLASRRAVRLRRWRVASVSRTAHDVFRDTHRASAVAEVLLFAERLRCGPGAPPPVRPLLRSTW